MDGTRDASRAPAALHLQFARVQRVCAKDRRRAGRALRRPSGGDRLADRQRDQLRSERVLLGRRPRGVPRVFETAAFSTLDAFNDAIGARFWNQSYTYVGRGGSGALHAARPRAIRTWSLLEKAFFSRQRHSLRKAAERQSCARTSGIRFITTNGIFGHLDNHRSHAVCAGFHHLRQLSEFRVIGRNPRNSFRKTSSRTGSGR